MIPPKLARIILIAFAVVVALSLLFAVRTCQQARTAAAREKLAIEQRGAALQSGHDAVETLGNATAREATIHDTVKEGSNEIAKALAGDSNAAADRAACRLRAYRRSSSCIALLGPAPK